MPTPAKVKAVPTTRAVITQECRENRGNERAWDEAVRRLRREYDAILDGWKDEDEHPDFVLSLLYERPIPDEAVPIPPLFCGAQLQTDKPEDKGGTDA